MTRASLGTATAAGGCRLTGRTRPGSGRLADARQRAKLIFAAAGRAAVQRGAQGARTPGHLLQQGQRLEHPWTAPRRQAVEQACDLLPLVVDELGDDVQSYRVTPVPGCGVEQPYPLACLGVHVREHRDQAVEVLAYGLGLGDAYLGELEVELATADG